MMPVRPRVARRRRRARRARSRRGGRRRRVAAAIRTRRLAPATVARRRRPPKPFRVIFPEGFTRAQMIERVRRSRRSRAQAPREAGRPRPRAVRRSRRSARDSVLHAAPAAEARGIPLPGDLRLPREDDLAAARTQQLEAFCTNWRKVEPLVREAEEPDAVRRADHRVDGREGDARAERAAARRGRHLQPPAPAHAARDRRDAAVRARHPADAVDPRSRSSTATTRTTRASCRACRRHRSRTPGSRRSGPRRIRQRSTTSTSCASPTRCTTSSPRATRRSRSTSARTVTAASAGHVALLGHPVAQSLSPRMQNAAFAARGLDWHYDGVRRRRRRSRRSLRCATLGFVGANVTIPHKQAVVAPATRPTATR